MSHKTDPTSFKKVKQIFAFHIVEILRLSLILLLNVLVFVCSPVIWGYLLATIGLRLVTLKLLWNQNAVVYKWVVKILTVHIILFFFVMLLVAYSIDAFYGELDFLYYWKYHREASIFVYYLEFWWYCFLALEVHERWKALEFLENKTQKESGLLEISENDLEQSSRL